MNSAKVWVGLDLGQHRTNVCVVDNSGALLHEACCSTTLFDLQAALAAYPTTSMGLIAAEAGADTHVIRKLRASGYPIAIFESRKASKFLAVRRNKTDSSDAHGLADLARLGLHTVSQVYLKSPACQQLRGQLVMRHRLVRLRVAAEGTLRSRMALYGRPFKTPYAPGSVRTQIDSQLAIINEQDGVDLKDDLSPLVDVCESLRAYLRQMDVALEKQAKGHPVCQRLMEVPGVGPICALSFYTAIEDPSRFNSSADVAAYLGLVPRRYQSGEISRTKGITKNGSKMTRTHLVTAATVFRDRGPDCALKEWALALRERIGPRRSKVALARKLAILLLTMWKNETHFERYPLVRRGRRSLIAGLD